MIYGHVAFSSTGTPCNQDVSVTLPAMKVRLWIHSELKYMYWFTPTPIDFP